MTTLLNLARRARDDRGSMPMVILVTIVGMLLSGLLLPALLQQDHTSRFDTSRVRALDGAQAGLDLVLGQIRNATDSSGAGDATSLPCGPVTGSVDGSGNVAYNVTIQYYTDDPTSNTSLSPMTCVSGYGTYDSGSGQITPAWAKLSSTGTSGTGAAGNTAGRTLVTTYEFQTKNTNIPGGEIRIYPASSSSASLCLDAGSATPADGASVSLQSCSTTNPEASQQVFVYRTDLTLQLLSSVTTSTPNGMCLADYNVKSTNANPAAGDNIKFAPCSALGSPPYYEQWSFNDSGGFTASLTTSASNGTLSSYCIDVATQTTNVTPTLVTCDGNVSSTRQAWVPEPDVGAGAAAAPQFVNYSEFGRCLDITGQNVSSTYLIDYPCKQNPYASAVLWNQKFTTPTIASGSSSASGTFYTTKSGTNYCMTSPLTSGGYVTVKTCGSASGQTWTFYNDDNSLPYRKKYTIVDSSGLCLGLTTSAVTVWSIIDVETCSGKSAQKWNAVPTTVSVLNTTEK
jgi:hypothetical protein